MLVLLLCNNTLQLLSSFSSFEDSMIAPPTIASGWARSFSETMTAKPPYRASPEEAGDWRRGHQQPRCARGSCLHRRGTRETFSKPSAEAKPDISSTPLQKDVVGERICVP
jgi:hypothetical protein